MAVVVLASSTQEVEADLLAVGVRKVVRVRSPIRVAVDLSGIRDRWAEPAEVRLGDTSALVRSHFHILAAQCVFYALCCSRDGANALSDARF